jgi:hypothetical protein
MVINFIRIISHMTGALPVFVNIQKQPKMIKSSCKSLRRTVAEKKGNVIRDIYIC